MGEKRRVVLPDKIMNCIHVRFINPFYNMPRIYLIIFYLNFDKTHHKINITQPIAKSGPK